MSNIANSLALITANFNRVTGRGPSFVGVTYTAKSTGEVARYVLNIGTSYLSLLRKSRRELAEIDAKDALEITAKVEVARSIEKSILAHKNGRQNSDYTKLGMYKTIAANVKEFKDGTCEIAGVVISKKVLVAGVRRTVNSRPLTLAKQAFEKQLAKSKYRTLCIDVGNLHTVKVGGSIIEVDGSLYNAAQAKVNSLTASPITAATVAAGIGKVTVSV